MMNKKADILEYASKHGEYFNSVEKVGCRNGCDVFSLQLLDANGFKMPTGLPVLVIEKDGKLDLKTGDEAFALLRSFGLLDE